MGIEHAGNLGDPQPERSMVEILKDHHSLRYGEQLTRDLQESDDESVVEDESHEVEPDDTSIDKPSAAAKVDRANRQFGRFIGLSDGTVPRS